MNCENALDLMLEADLPELRGEGDSDLAQHVRTCVDCRARAETILAGQEALAEAMDRVTPHAPAPDLTRRAQERARRRPWRVALPLALAAGIATLLLLRQPSAGPQPPSSPPRVAAAPLDVMVPPGRTVAVFQTENPNIVVIWSF